PPRSGRPLETEDELRVLGHPVRGPRRLEGQLGFDVLDTRELADHAVDVLLDHRAGRAAHRGQRVAHFHLRALAFDVVEQPEVDDGHPELGIFHLMKGIDDFLAARHGFESSSPRRPGEAARAAVPDIRPHWYLGCRWHWKRPISRHIAAATLHA